MKPSQPLIVVCGPTGTGKSKLAVSLAKRFNGEIINADAVQMYKGLPIVTNKIPVHEMEGIPHHLLGEIELTAAPWNVTNFTTASISIIERIRARGRIPIVVGGTGHYIKGLAFTGTLTTDEKSNNQANDDITNEGPRVQQQDPAFAVLDGTTEELYAKLMELDPIMAQRWHPNDHRKIRRSLELCLQTGRKASSIYAEQKSTASGNGTMLRYDALFFWLNAAEDVLKPRLDKRVDGMLEQGLLDEVVVMRNTEEDMQKRGRRLDTASGVWVSIGYKELADWLNARNNLSLSDGDRAQLQARGIDAIKTATRQYAKYQNRYLRLHFGRVVREAQASDRLFLLDTSNLDEWASVERSGVDLTESFLKGEVLPSPASLSLLARDMFENMETSCEETPRARYCETCDTRVMTQKEWDSHMASNSHKRRLAGQRKRAAYEAFLKSRENDESTKQAEAEKG